MPISLKVMISIHVPKTGGTSFRRMLEDLFGDGFQQDYDWEPRPSLMDGPELQGSDDEIWAMFAGGIRCVHGHFNARKYLRLREIEGIEPLFITWLRDPAERCMSTYHFLRKLDTPPAEQPEWERAAKSLSVRDFFEQTRYGANRQFAQLRALDRDELAFIGCTERFDDSARIFRHLFFPHVPDVRIEHELKNEERTGKYHIPAPLRAPGRTERLRRAALPVWPGLAVGCAAQHARGDRALRLLDASARATAAQANAANIRAQLRAPLAKLSTSYFSFGE